MLMSAQDSSPPILCSKLHLVTTVFSGTSLLHITHANLTVGIYIEHYDSSSHGIAVKMLTLKRKNNCGRNICTF